MSVLVDEAKRKAVFPNFDFRRGMLLVEQLKAMHERYVYFAKSHAEASGAVASMRSALGEMVDKVGDAQALKTVSPML